MDELRTLFLFESLDDEQLAWLPQRGVVEDVPAGRDVYAEGEPADVLLHPARRARWR